MSEIRVVHNGFSLKGVSADLGAEIKDFLTYPNPKYEQAKQYSKWGEVKSIPREIRYYRVKDDCIKVPYGFPIENFFGKEVEIKGCVPIRNYVTFLPFKLELRKTQQNAFDAYFKFLLEKRSNYGQIVMPTGKGKTILALAIAARLGVRTLVIVHKSDLVKVWTEDVALALQMPVGIIQGSKRKIDDITVATIQTLTSMRKNRLLSKEFLTSFDLIIVDEAHHCPASTYDIIDNFSARYRIGLTATPERNDGLSQVLNLFFGSPCYVYENDGEDEDILPVEVKVRNVSVEYNPLVSVIREVYEQNYIEIALVDEFYDISKKAPKGLHKMSQLTGIKIGFPPNFNRATMERSIVNNVETFNEVFQDLFSEVKSNHSCILFFKQKEEVDWWYDKINERKAELGNDPFICPVKYYGDNSEQVNKRVLCDVEDGFYNITLTTLAKCGEGTNCKAWERVFLISSIANGKDVEQAIGRARRIKKGKSKVVIVYDYRFPNVSGLNLYFHGKTRDERYNELKFTGDSLVRYLPFRQQV